MKRIITTAITIACLVFSMNIQAQEKPKKINWGMKCGFNSSMFFIKQLLLNETTIDQLQNNYKLDYSGSVFARFNLKKHFIQTEAEYMVSKSEIQFDKNIMLNLEGDPDYAYINSKISSIDFSVLYGYNFIKESIFVMNVFAGPKLKYIINNSSRTEINKMKDTELVEDFKPVNMACILGIGVNIDKWFFDFRYEIGFANISKSIHSVRYTDTQPLTSEVIMERHYNSLSFNIGIIF